MRSLDTSLVPLPRWAAAVALLAASACVGRLGALPGDALPGDAGADDAAAACGSGVDCDDGVACTEDACDPASGACTATARHERCEAGALCRAPGGCAPVGCASDGDCDDGDACNGAERCEAGACAAGEPLRCDDGVFCNGAERCDPMIGCAPGAAPRCDDRPACAEDRCDPALDRCVAAARDGDGDGHGEAACGGDDCDDADPAVRPGGEERCGDGVDGDCDGVVDQGCGCTPATCATAGAACGAVPDGCGGTLDCGPCGERELVGMSAAPEASGVVEVATLDGSVRLVWTGSRWVLLWIRLLQACRREADPGGGWDHLVCEERSRALVATEIDAAGAPLAPVREIGLPVADPSFAVLARAGGFVVSFVERPASGTPRVRYAFLDASFRPTVDRSFDARGAGRTWLAGDGATIGLVWDGGTPHQYVSFASIGADGTRGARTSLMFTSVFPDISHQLSPQLAWDGTSFGWAFETDRERLRRCGCDWVGGGDPVEVMFMRLSPSGVPLSAVRLSEGIEEGMSAATSIDLAPRPGGGFVVAWLSSVGGRDVAAALVGADGRKEGSNRRITSDGDAVTEIQAHLARTAPGGYLASWASHTGDLWSSGIRALALDETGAPAGAPTDVVAPPPACGDRCFASLSLFATAGGPPRAALAVWLSQTWTELFDPPGVARPLGHVVAFGRRSPL